MQENIKHIIDSYLNNGLDSSLLYQMIAEYNGGQIAVEIINTLPSGKKKIISLRGVIEYIYIEQINTQEAVRVRFGWLAAKLSKKYILTNIRNISFTKYQCHDLTVATEHGDSLVIFLLDEDEDEQLSSTPVPQLIRIDLIAAHDPRYLVKPDQSESPFMLN